MVEDAESYHCVATPRPDVVVVSIRGQVSGGPTVARMTGRVEAALREGRDMLLFFDFEGFTHYEPKVRASYTRAITSHLDHLSALYVHADSKLVRMGTTVAGLVIPQVRLVDRDEFHTRLEAALAK